MWNQTSCWVTNNTYSGVNQNTGYEGKLTSSAWRRGENGSPFNVELRETQSIVCISTG